MPVTFFFVCVVSALIFLHGFEFISRYQVNVLPQPVNSSGPSLTSIAATSSRWMALLSMNCQHLYAVYPCALDLQQQKITKIAFIFVSEVPSQLLAPEKLPNPILNQYFAMIYKFCSSHIREIQE